MRTSAAIVVWVTLGHLLLLALLWLDLQWLLRLTPRPIEAPPLEFAWVRPIPPAGAVAPVQNARPESPPPEPLAVEPVPTEKAQAQQAGAPTPPIDRVPKSGALAMEAYWGEFGLDRQPLGRGEIVLGYPGEERYEIALVARAVGWLSAFVSGPVEIRSEGKLTPEGLVPQRYRQNTPRRGLQESVFDAATNTARLKADGPTVPAPAGLQDRLSVVFQIAWIGESQKGGLAPGQRFTFPLATDKELKHVAFQVGDEEDLVLPGGILVPALRVTSDPIDSRRMGLIDVWLDPTDRHLPVRIRYTEPSGRALDFLAIRSAP
jgi:hypothetical protein